MWAGSDSRPIMSGVVKTDWPIICVLISNWDLLLYIGTHIMYLIITLLCHFQDKEITDIPISCYKHISRKSGSLVPQGLDQNFRNAMNLCWFNGTGNGCYPNRINYLRYLAIRETIFSILADFSKRVAWFLYVT